MSPGDVWAELHLAGPHLGVDGEGAVLHVHGVAQPALLLRHLTRAHTAAAGIRASNEPSRRLREVLQSRRRSLLWPLLGWKRLPAPTQWICWPDFLAIYGSGEFIVPSRGLLRASKTSRHLREPLFEALVPWHIVNEMWVCANSLPWCKQGWY